MSELIPCPHCNNNRISEVVIGEHYKTYTCNLCHATGMVMTAFTPDEILRRGWNNRPREDALQSEIEQLKSIIGFKDDALSSYSDFYASCCKRLGYEDVKPSAEMDEIIWNKLTEVRK